MPMPKLPPLRLADNDEPMKQRRKWGSVKETVARLSHMTAPEIVRATGISRYSVYESARQQQIKLPPAVFQRKRLYADV